MIDILTRGRLLALVGAGVAFAPRRTFGAGLLPIKIGALTSDVSGQLQYAQAEGMYKRAGVDAQTQMLANGGAIVAAIAGGALDVGFANLTSIAVARQRGLPIRIVAPAAVYTSKAPVTVLAKARDQKYRTGADLHGKTIAVSTLKGELQVGASTWIDKTGGDSTQVTFLELPFSSMAAALTAGRIAGAMVSEPAFTRNRESIDLLADAYSAIAPEFLIGGFVAQEAWIRDNADAAKRFASAMLETAKYANEHHDETAAVLAKSSGLEEKVIRSMTRASYGERLVPGLIQPVLDAAFKYGSLKAPMTAKELIG